MGIFGSRKKTYVSSVVYNLAGDVESRPNFLKTTVLSNVIYKTGESISRTIVRAYLRGPGISMPRFARWAKTSGFNDTIGQIGSTIVLGGSIPESVLVDNTPHSADDTVNIMVKKIGPADYSWWAEQWILANHPDDFDLDWTADIEGTTITITMGESGTVYTFNADGFDYEKTYLYYTYSFGQEPSDGESVVGPVIEIPEGDPFPSADGWTLLSQDVIPKTMDLDTTTMVKKTYSDGRPDEETTDTVSSTQDYSEIHQVYDRTTYKGDYPSDPNKTYSLHETWYRDQIGELKTGTTSDTIEEDIGDGVIRTTTTTVTTETVRLVRTHHTDSQETLFAGVSTAIIRIYAKGDGVPAFDDLFQPSIDTGVFYPFIPVRLDNKFISPTFLPTVYEASKKGYKKVFGKDKFDELIDNIADNESIDDIDFAYITFGVSLNVIDKSALRYVYLFFKSILESFTAGSPAEYDAYRAAWNASRDSVAAYRDWKIAQADPLDPLFGTPAPKMLEYPSMPNREINIRNSDQYNITISWKAIAEDVGSGLYKPDASMNDVWWNVGTPDYLQGDVAAYTGVWATMIEKSSVVELIWQETSTSWRKLTMIGLTHENQIYKGKGVEIHADEAIDDIEESGFIVPLHEEIFNNMRMIDRTQMATADSFILFNCYQVVKKKWYQTGLFQVVLIIVIIVIAVFFPPGGAAASGGILGTNAAVGAALGVAAGTVAALIVGAIANAVAAMLLVAIIQRGAQAIFGDKLGSIIGAIAAVIALNVASSAQSGQSWSEAFSSMSSAQNIIALTEAVGDGYAGYVQADTQEVLARTQDMLAEYSEQTKEIQQLYAETFGTDSKAVIDPIKVTESSRINAESVDSFLSRTLMAGSDIVDLSYALLDNFADISLNTNLT